MSVDLRTRTDGELPDVDPAELFEHELPARLASAWPLVGPGAERLCLRPLGIEVGDRCWSLCWEDGAIGVRRGAPPGAARVRLGPDDLTGLVHDQYTPMTFYVSGRLDMPAGIGVSGLESDGNGRFFCGGGPSGKLRVVRRPGSAAR